MVRKLFKHELVFHLRSLLLVWGVLLGVALLGRGVQLVEQDSVIYNVISVSSIIVYVLAVVVCLFAPVVLGVVRFYKNLFTGEGYLSFTLPVTPFQHIWVKITAAVLMEIATVVVCLLSVAVITMGDVFAEIIKAAVYLVKQVYQELGDHLVFYVMELLLMLLTVALCQMLLFYACIAVGQLFKKNRVAASVGVYFGYYFVSQVFGTVLGIVVAVIPESTWEKVGTYILENIKWCMHGFFGGYILLSLVMSVVYFAVTNAIIHKRLNLE